jgi:hypothetical protein
VIHNAAVQYGRDVLPVNIVAPYLLTVLIHRPNVWSTSVAACIGADARD